MNSIANPILLYSTNTWLSFAIAERFYKQIHYVWCSPFFDSESAPDSALMPPSSTPADIYRDLYQAIKRRDRHCYAIERNKLGILRGATEKLTAGVIDPDTEGEIAAIVEIAELSDFIPLLYVIPFSMVRNLMAPAPVDERAHPLSPEFRIEELPKNCFDILKIG